MGVGRNELWIERGKIAMQAGVVKFVCTTCGAPWSDDHTCGSAPIKYAYPGIELDAIRQMVRDELRLFWYGDKDGGPHSSPVGKEGK